ncbi:hypothetical protein OU995_16085 [Roseateles sp. SL47]|uniref:Acb2/Tad1 domain-containing protein n=1 Tax=Roseateles sp. SL47 TaxID=2995138 RepID=UPI00226EC774|nr:hypothetical protein [Roseateles sp. SL47]WAC71116.1 hypothetical protein OU995_16085 [Roseateles sp. SL47]
MDNQHKQITGYRDLSQAEIDGMNRIKAHAQQIGALFDELKDVPGIDQRWLSVGRTHCQQGFMAATRAIAQPTTF